MADKLRAALAPLAELLALGASADPPAAMLAAGPDACAALCAACAALLEPTERALAAWEADAEGWALDGAGGWEEAPGADDDDDGADDDGAADDDEDEGAHGAVGAGGDALQSAGERLLVALAALHPETVGALIVRRLDARGRCGGSGASGGLDRAARDDGWLAAAGLCPWELSTRCGLGFDALLCALEVRLVVARELRAAPLHKADARTAERALALVERRGAWLLGAWWAFGGAAAAAAALDAALDAANGGAETAAARLAHAEAVDAAAEARALHVLASVAGGAHDAAARLAAVDTLGRIAQGGAGSACGGLGADGKPAGRAALCSLAEASARAERAEGAVYALRVLAGALEAEPRALLPLGIGAPEPGEPAHAFEAAVFEIVRSHGELVCAHPPLLRALKLCVRAHARACEAAGVRPGPALEQLAVRLAMPGRTTGRP